MCMVTPYWLYRFVCFKLTSEDNEDVLYRVELLLLPIHLKNENENKSERKWTNEVNQLHRSGFLGNMEVKHADEEHFLFLFSARAAWKVCEQSVAHALNNVFIHKHTLCTHRRAMLLNQSNAVS